MALPLVLVLALAANTPTHTARDQATAAPAGDELTIGRYRLQRRPGGEYEATTEVFTARIAADGTVSFKHRFRLPGPAVWPVLVAAEALRTATGGKSIDPDPRGGASTRPSIQRPTLTLSDEDLRRDSHHAAKMTFLEATAAFREGLRVANDRSALASFEKRVLDAAADPARSPAQRRQDLFELWLDCDEGPRGAPARAVVESVAARQFPAGAPQAFSTAELARLNARAPAGLRFMPYPSSAAPDARAVPIGK